MRASSKLPLMAVLAGLAGMGTHRGDSTSGKVRAGLRPAYLNLPSFDEVKASASGRRGQFKRNQRRQGNRKTLSR